ncbi:MAG TPA: hypothetical protein VF489_09575 [Sphingobium sp.]|uniref:hypothetical protein n=1 Tax=Sphingobium sp. TaxID=1912891 RepID=UPI002ED20B99
MSFDYEWDQRRARDLIGCLVEETGFSATEIARRSGLAPSTLTRIYPTSTVGYSLSARSIAKLREAFPEPFSMYEAVAPSPSAMPSLAPAGMLKDRSHAFAMPSPRLIPVYATTLLFPEEGDAALANDLEVWEGNLSRPAAHMAVPFGLSDPDRYFAIYIPGEAMEPRFRAGERVILDRIRPASIDTDVLVQLRDDSERSLWTIGRLTARDRNLISLTQYRDQVTGSIHRSRIKHIFPIIGMIDDDS